MRKKKEAEYWLMDHRNRQFSCTGRRCFHHAKWYEWLCQKSKYSHSWCSFQAVNTTPEVLASTFPQNVLGFLITAIFWGFFEGFNYVVIRDKISAYYPSKYRFFDWGALVCASLCILIHGAAGVTPEAVLEMISTFILIYGMLIVRKETGNARGCILIFFVYWNAFWINKMAFKANKSS